MSSPSSVLQQAFDHPRPGVSRAECPLPTFAPAEQGVYRSFRCQSVTHPEPIPGKLDQQTNMEHNGLMKSTNEQEARPEENGLGEAGGVGA